MKKGGREGERGVMNSKKKKGRREEGRARDEGGGKISPNLPTISLTSSHSAR